jgi:isopenicillin N synthase-like dioxygenase
LPYGDDVFNDFVANDPICNLRLLHYPPHTSKDPRQRGAGAHTDFGAITLLLQDMSGGLEVLDYATGQYVPVDPNPDAYVVNIGDMMQMWTKGVYKSTMHRVINKGSGDRYSMPFFFDGNAEVKLNPLDGSAPPDGDAPTVLEHMAERFGTTYGPFVDEKPKASSTGSTVVKDQPTTSGIAMQPQGVSVEG